MTRFPEIYDLSALAALLETIDNSPALLLSLGDSSTLTASVLHARVRCQKSVSHSGTTMAVALQQSLMLNHKVPMSHPTAGTSCNAS